jgi:hypothetical protein
MIIEKTQRRKREIVVMLYSRFIIQILLELEAGPVEPEATSRLQGNEEDQC